MQLKPSTVIVASALVQQNRGYVSARSTIKLRWQDGPLRHHESFFAVLAKYPANAGPQYIIDGVVQRCCAIAERVSLGMSHQALA